MAVQGSVMATLTRSGRAAEQREQQLLNDRAKIERQVAEDAAQALTHDRLAGEAREHLSELAELELAGTIDRDEVEKRIDELEGEERRHVRAAQHCREVAERRRELLSPIDAELGDVLFGRKAATYKAAAEARADVERDIAQQLEHLLGAVRRLERTRAAEEEARLEALEARPDDEGDLPEVPDDLDLELDARTTMIADNDDVGGVVRSYGAALLTDSPRGNLVLRTTFGDDLLPLIKLLAAG